MKVVISLQGFVSIIVGNPIPQPINEMICCDVKWLEQTGENLVIFFNDGHTETIDNKYIKFFIVGEP